MFQLMSAAELDDHIVVANVRRGGAVPRPRADRCAVAGAVKIRDFGRFGALSGGKKC
jgi:hypothetical protein